MERTFAVETASGLHQPLVSCTDYLVVSDLLVQDYFVSEKPSDLHVQGLASEIVVRPLSHSFVVGIVRNLLLVLCPGASPWSQAVLALGRLGLAGSSIVVALAPHDRNGRIVRVLCPGNGSLSSPQSCRCGSHPVV